MIVFVAVLVAPVVYAIVLSLFRQQLIGGTAFVGLENYAQLLQDQKFWESFLRVTLFLVVQAELYSLITRLRDRHGCGVLMVSHDLHLVMSTRRKKRNTESGSVGSTCSFCGM